MTLARVRLTVFVSLFFAAWLASPARAQSFTEYPVPSGSTPNGIAKGPDGALWYTADAASGLKVGQVTTSGAFTEYTVRQPSTASMTDIVAGADGALYYGIFDSAPSQITIGPAIGRITTSGSFFEVLTHETDGLGLGPDGAVWFGAGAEIGRFSGGVSYFNVAPCCADAVTAGSDGALWYLSSTQPEGIGRFTTSGALTFFPLPITGSGPQNITLGPGGALWFTERDANRIGRITTSELITEFAIPTPGSRPAVIAAGPDGAMWFTEANGKKIGRITVPAATNWTVAGAGDVNADGKADLFWRDSAGNLVVSLMNGASIASSTLLANLPANWTVAAIGDFNGDTPVHKSDILWRNTATGDTVISFMNGATIVSSTFVANLPGNWVVVGVVDFNGDGKADVLWRNNTGAAVVSLMNGAAISASTLIASLP